MRIDKTLYLVVVMMLLTGFGLTGCGKKGADVSAEITASEGLGPEESLETTATEIMEGRTSGPMLPIYFGFDQSSVNDEQARRLEGNAAFLKDEAGLKIRVEGNCDPRGTREYNLALGERRALSTKQYLVNLGIDPERLSTISWGEEKLLLFGHDEISWTQNRRADFVIVK
ncbi:OmpA family protein [Desulfogranum mediterraneum]|uniref:OmpA family protein n=1 Tax=Desulfogranum mediterraneum TaxID=160661 RepID=UPI00041F5D02|nr:OmpA family protein [Desulfogranum mediterraneum]